MERYGALLHIVMRMVIILATTVGVVAMSVGLVVTAGYNTCWRFGIVYQGNESYLPECSVSCVCSRCDGIFLRDSSASLMVVSMWSMSNGL